MDTGEVIIRSQGWKDFSYACREGQVPHTLAIRAKKEIHSESVLMFAEKLLCLNGVGNDECPSCREWHNGAHPDLLVYGSLDKAPGIDICRQMIQEIPLKPVVSSRRVAVVFSADKLSIPASNSLLKLTEEPPDQRVILLMLEEDNLIPTLKSRSRTIFIPFEKHFETMEIPVGDEQWVQWIQDNAGKGIDELIEILDRWIDDRVNERDFEKAKDLETIRLLAKSRKLSKNMVFDMICLYFKEGIILDDISRDIW